MTRTEFCRQAQAESRTNRRKASGAVRRAENAIFLLHVAPSLCISYGNGSWDRSDACVVLTFKRGRWRGEQDKNNAPTLAWIVGEGWVDPASLRPGIRRANERVGCGAAPGRRSPARPAHHRLLRSGAVAVPGDDRALATLPAAGAARRLHLHRFRRGNGARG